MRRKRPENSTIKSVQRAKRLLAAVAVIALLAAPVTALAHQAGNQANEPRYGGTISFREAFPPSCLDGAKTSEPDYADFAALDTLVSSDSQNRYRPDLATKWSISHGGRWITFYLRHGVRFSNGNPFNATAVKFTFDRALAPGFSAGTASLLGPIQQIKILNAYTVRFIMKEAFRPILYAVQFGEFGIMDPRATKDRNLCTQGPIGTGPYKIQGISPGFTTMTLVRNPYHTWGPVFAHNRGPSYTSKLIIKAVASDTTAISSLLSGEVNISKVPGTQLSRVQGNPNFVLHKQLNRDLWFLGFNMAHSPFNKVAVRRAVAEVIDRAAIVKVALNGLGIPAYSTLARNIPYFDPKAKASLPSYNPAGARRIFAKYHVTGPYTFLVWNTGGSAAAVAQIIQAELQQAGVKVNIVSQTDPDFENTARKGNDDLFFFVYGDGDADIYSFEWASDQETSTGYNFSFYKSSTLDHLIAKGHATVKPKSAARVYSQIQTYMNRNVIVVPLYTDYAVYAVDKALKGWNTYFGGGPLFQDLYFSK